MPDRRNTLREHPAPVVLGEVSAEETAHARRLVGDILARVDHAVEDPRVRLSRYGGHDTVTPVVVIQVNVAVCARMVRVQVAAPTFAAALDQAAEGLGQRLRRLDRHLAAERSGDVGFIAGEWCSPHPQNPVGLVDGRPGAQRLIRMKDYHLAVQNTDAAAFTMDLRDYPFHLFVDDATGADAVIYRGGATGYRLHRSVAGPVP